MASFLLAALGCFVWFISIMELILIPEMYPRNSIRSEDLFIGVGSLIVSGLAFGTAWFLRGDVVNFTDREGGFRAWFSNMVIATVIVSLLSLGGWSYFNDPTLLREMLTGI